MIISKNRSREERWVIMTELEGEPLLHHFKISNLGNVVKIKKAIGPELLFEPKNISGYKYISFSTHDGTRQTIYLHRLVASFFVESPGDSHIFVIHMDYNRSNNCWDNLKWVEREVFYKHRSKRAGRPRKVKPAAGA